MSALKAAFCGGFCGIIYALMMPEPHATINLTPAGIQWPVGIKFRDTATTTTFTYLGEGLWRDGDGNIYDFNNY